MKNQKQKSNTTFRVDVLSLFPKFFQSPLEQSILKRALTNQLIEVYSHNIRDFATNAYGQVDDTSYGGGPGMVLMPEPIKKALDSVKKRESHTVYLSPQGKKLTPEICKKLAQKKHLILLCGHYEGVDERIIQSEIDEEISIGDYIITSGCPAALVLLDATARFIPGVVGDPQSTDQDSFEQVIFDHPHYTKPLDFNGLLVPEVLTNGHHQKIEEFRKSQAIQKTQTVRPDLFQKWLATKASVLLSCKDLNEIERFFTPLFPLKKEEGYLLMQIEKDVIAFIKSNFPSAICSLKFSLSKEKFSALTKKLNQQQIEYLENSDSSLMFTDFLGISWLFQPKP